MAALFSGVVEYLLGLCGKGNLMLDVGLHMVGGDLPDGGFKVDLVPQNDMEVLFGNERTLYVDDVPELDREPNGVWSMGHGTGIGAFFSVQKADIWNFPYASGCLYINPSQTCACRTRYGGSQRNPGRRPQRIHRPPHP